MAKVLIEIELSKYDQLIAESTALKAYRNHLLMNKNTFIATDEKRYLFEPFGMDADEMQRVIANERAKREAELTPKEGAQDNQISAEQVEAQANN